MKSREEVQKIAQELCPRTDSECAVFINGFVRGWEECLKELGYEFNKKENQ